ncbi:putative E3 ubiquitin ligase [Handroanthus impetiginosus]|uniref:E3 ubiquitin-protein ligase RMA n=1 Tax=Handroanthus impetiginosus TaxID=429701 RepID=A0A2G9HPZ8_9LAMI|nr:putative E3 ubiquitin ligase [Handroanthus impetiginosus]
MAEADQNEVVGDFQCNICFDLAQDPVITLCGHLHCWPCLYKWLKHHSQSHECPVCKALIDEDKLIPLYGRGKTTTEPRSKPVPGLEIPNRPPGRRPETAPPQPPPRRPQLQEANDLSNAVFGRMGSDFGFSPNFSFQVQGFSSTTGYGGLSRYIYGYNGLIGEGENGGNIETRGDEQETQESLKKVHIFILVCVIFALLTL